MRNLLAGLIVAGLLVAPVLGAVDVQVLINPTVNADGTLVTGTGVNTVTLNAGQTATVGVFFKANTNGMVSIGGDVTATGASVLNAPTAFAFLPTFSGFQGVWDGSGALYPNTTIPPTKTLGTNGAVSLIGSSYGVANSTTPAYPGTFASATLTQLFSYTVTAGSNPGGTVTLNWANAALPGNSGWYTLDTAAGTSVNTPTSASITVNPAPSQVNFVSSNIGPAVAGAKTLNRTTKNIVRFTFSGNMVAPTAGQLQIQQMNAGGTYGADLSSNFTFTVEGGTVLKIVDTGAHLTSGQWYSFRNTGSWAGVANFEMKIPVLMGDVNGDGTVSSSGDVTAMVSSMGKPATGDNDRKDINSDGTISSSGDITALVPYMGKSVSLTAPF